MATAEPAADPLAPTLRERPAAGLPEWFPPWARRVAELYFSGTTSAFVLHGNTHDFVRGGDGYGTLTDFLAEQLFGRWDLVLYYNLGRGLAVYAGRSAARQAAMVEAAHRAIPALGALKPDPAQVIAALDRFVRGTVMAPEGKRLSAAIVVDHASFVFPAGEPGRQSPSAAAQLVTVLNWASSLPVKQANLAFVLVDERLSDLSDRLTGNPHVAAVEVALPARAEREHYVRALVGEREVGGFSDYDVPSIAELTAGISLADVGVLLRSAMDAGERLDEALFRGLKKRLIERQCQGLLEFVEPKWTLDMLIGHQPIKDRLREDAELLRRGALDSMPMGYLVCGPVGTGKTFLAQCLAGEIGVPCVTLKNFRSKYVGETEGNLERVLSVLRAMGPVVVIVDEADAALGNRGQSGDSGTSSRVFSMIANQMGDSRYRGRIVWMLLTARPDLLPIDLKRQGRAEIHIPLFYPTEDEELGRCSWPWRASWAAAWSRTTCRTFPRSSGEGSPAPTSRGWWGARCAPRCWPGRRRSPARRWRRPSRSSCRPPRVWRRSCRRSPPSSSAPSASSSLRLSSRGWRRRAGARCCSSVSHSSSC
jgi:hypothetical protein